MFRRVPLISPSHYCGSCKFYQQNHHLRKASFLTCTDKGVTWRSQQGIWNLLRGPEREPAAVPRVRCLSKSFLSSKGVDKTVGRMAEANQAESSGSVAAAGNGDRSKCVFCKIVDGKEGNEIYYQDDEIVVFQDIKPAATYHYLAVSREHIRDCKTLGPSQLGLLERLTQVGTQVLAEQMQKDGAGSPEQVQKLMGFHWPPFHTVAHLHLHIIAPSNEMGFMARTIFRPGIWFVTADYVRERLEKMGAAPGGQ